MKHLLTAAIMTAMLATPAVAQFGGGGRQKTPLDLQYEREKKDQEENERAYNTQMKRLKSQTPTTTSQDPWKGVRSTNDSTAKR